MATRLPFLAACCACAAMPLWLARQSVAQSFRDDNLRPGFEREVDIEAEGVALRRTSADKARQSGPRRNPSATGAGRPRRPMQPAERQAAYREPPAEGFAHEGSSYSESCQEDEGERDILGQDCGCPNRLQLSYDAAQDPLALITGGFFFLRPFTDHSGNFDLRNIAPQSTAALNSLGADNLFNDFGFAPTLNADFSPTFDNKGGVTASGMGIVLNGALDRSITSNNATTRVQESGAISIVSANVEGYFTDKAPVLRYAAYNYGAREGQLSRGQVKEPAPNRFTVGAKVLTLSQTLGGTITDPASGTTIFSAMQQNQTLLGVTGSWQAYRPMFRGYASKGGWALYGTARGSVVVGPNKRESSVTFTPTGGDAGPPTSFSDNETQWVPIGEFELGLDYRTKGAYANEVRTVSAFRAAAVFQIYGNLGVTSAAAANQFSNTNLYLIGGVVQAAF